MIEFAKYDAMRADGIAASQANAIFKSQGANPFAGIRMLRASYGFTPVEAKELCFCIDTGRSVHASDPGLIQAIVETLDALPAHQDQLNDSSPNRSNKHWR